MSDLALLLTPKWLTARNSSRNPGDRYKGLLLALLALGFCAGIFWATDYVLSYIKELYVGPGLEFMELRFEINRRLLGMAVMTFMAVLIFSNVITALSTFFLSDDLELVGALPVSRDSLFLARFLEMMVDSSWMIVVFGTPVYIAFGVVYGAGAVYYLAIPAVTVPFILIPAGLGVIVTMALVSAFPARRIRDIIFLMAVFAAGILFVLFRFLQPEKLVNPDVQLEVMDFIRTLQAPMKSWMPNFWVTEIFAELARGGLGPSGRLYLALLWTSGLGMGALALLFSRAFYSDSFSKSQEATRTIISRSGPIGRLIQGMASIFGPGTRQMVIKDTLFFMRDTTQWSQVFLLGAIVVIYIFNFRFLPLSRMGMDQFKLQNVVSYLNIGLAGFVVTALSARFVFPMVSLEGRAFWVVKTSPLSLKGFLWSKFLISALPLLVIGEFLIVVTNFYLQVSSVVWYVGVATICGMTFAICGMGVGLGARFPRFTAENPAKVATSFGGVIYMIVSMSVIGLVVLMEASPTYIYFMAGAQGRALGTGELLYIAASFAVVIAALIAATVAPMSIGLRWIEKMEIG
jgi:ABC-2 type transport system permease protein